jgi:hypothetical protein
VNTSLNIVCVQQQMMMQPQQIGMMVRKTEPDVMAALFVRKRHLLRRAVRALVFKNAALCDEVARLHQRVSTTVEERKCVIKYEDVLSDVSHPYITRIIMKRLLHHSRLRVRRETNAQRRQEAKEAAAAIQTSQEQQQQEDTIPQQHQEQYVPPTSSYNDTINTTSPMYSRHNDVFITADMIEHGDITNILEDE